MRWSMRGGIPKKDCFSTPRLGPVPRLEKTQPLFDLSNGFDPAYYRELINEPIWQTYRADIGQGIRDERQLYPYPGVVLKGVYSRNRSQNRVDLITGIGGRVNRYDRPV